MEITEILSGLECCAGRMPTAELEAAERHKEEITPELLDIIRFTLDNAEALRADYDYVAHITALFLLAKFREKRAYPLVIEIYSLQEDVLDDLLGDVITMGLPKILASVCDGDVAPIKALVENRNVYEFARSSALEALVHLMFNATVERKELIDYFKYLYNGGLEKEPVYVWTSMACILADIHPAELYDEVMDSFKQNLIEGMSILPREIEEAMKLGEAAALQKWGWKYKGLVDDVAREMRWMECFSKDWKKRKKAKASDYDFTRPVSGIDSGGTSSGVNFAGLPLPPGTFVHKSEKIGRNDPCPCGSGKKFKKCCGR